MSTITCPPFITNFSTLKRNLCKVDNSSLFLEVVVIQLCSWAALVVLHTLQIHLLKRAKHLKNRTDMSSMVLISKYFIPNPLYTSDSYCPASQE